MRLIDFLLILSFIISIDCQQEDKQTSKIKIAVPKNATFALLWIANENNYFIQSAVDVELISDEDPSSLYQNGKVDLICSDLTLPILLHSEGINTEIIYRFTYSSGNEVIIAEPKIKKIEELKFKTISFNGVNTSSHIFVEEILNKKNIKEGEYKTNNLKPEFVTKEIDRGTIQAGHTKIKYLRNEPANKYRILARSSDLPDLITDVMSGRASFVRKHKIEIEKIIDASLKARDFYINNPEKSKEILAKVFSENKSAISSEIDSLRFLSREENIQSLGNGSQNFVNLSAPNEKNFGFELGHEKRGALFHASETIIQFLSNRGQLYKKPNLNQLIVNDYLRKTKTDENRK